MRASYLGGRDNLSKKNDTAFLDMAREWRRGDTKRRWRQGDRDLARSRYKRRALTGHKRRST